MITQFKVENFKALKSVRVDLGPFTVLIGPNDTGKSSFVEALYALTESAKRQLSECFWTAWSGKELVYRQSSSHVRFQSALGSGSTTGQENSSVKYGIALSFHNQSCQLNEETVASSRIGAGERGQFPRGQTFLCDYGRNGSVPPNPQDPNTPLFREHELELVKTRIPRAVIARWNVGYLAKPSALPSNRPFVISPLGYGLSTAIAELRLADFDRFSSLLRDFRQLFPFFRDIRIKRGIANRPSTWIDPYLADPGKGGESYALFLVQQDGLEIAANSASGGSLVALAILVLAYWHEPSKLLLIEEPENGLHPKLLEEVVKVLQRAAKDQGDKQVVLTTHSPLLLDYVEPEDVRIFLRNEQGDIEVHNVANVPDVKERLKYLMLGELIYNEGEENLIKEIREHADTRAGGGSDGSGPD